MAEDIKLEIGYKDSASAAVDKTVADIVAQQKKLVAAFKASGIEVEKLDGKLKDVASGDTHNLAERLGIKDLSREFKAAKKHAADLHRSVSSFVPAFAALSAAATAAGIGHMFTSWTGAAAQLDRTAMSMGVSVDRLDQTQTALRLTGASAEAATTGLQGLQQTMRGALFGGDAQSFALFKGLGIDIGSFDKGARRALDVIPQVADAVKRVYRPGNPDAALNVLSRFGLGPEWLTVLKDGSAGWERYMEASGKAGTITQQQADATKALQQEQERLNIALEHFGYQIAGEIGPELTPIIADMAKWVEVNKDWLSQDIAGALHGVLQYVASGKWAEFSGTIGDLVKQFSGWKDGIAAIGAEWNKLDVKMIADLAVLAAIPVPWWAKILLATPGDAAHNPEADEAMNRQIGSDTAEYYRTHPWENPDLNGDVLGQGPPGRRAPPKPSIWQRIYGAVFGGPAQNASRAVALDVPPEGRALLDAIAAGESGGNYTMVNRLSGAYGRYQFLNTTWQETAAQTGLQERTSENQDRNAWRLAQERYQRATGGRNLLADLRAGRNVAPFLSGTWPSLPGGTQPNALTPSFNERLAEGLHQVENSGSTSASAPQQPGAGNYGSDDTDHFGRLRVEVIHQNPPPGASLNVTAPDGGNITVAPPLVMQAMPGAGRNVARDGY